MDIDFEIPVVDGRQRIPRLRRDAGGRALPERLRGDVDNKVDFRASLPADWLPRAVNRLGELLATNRGLRVFLDACTHCGACTAKCHYFLGTGDPKNMPVARQDLLRAVYRRYFTLAGKWLPWLVGARALDEKLLEDWYRYFHQCSECRRCTVYCPFGIDTTEVTMAARSILEAVGVVQEYTGTVQRQIAARGNNLGLPQPVIDESLAVLEEDIEEQTGTAVRLPLDAKGAEVLLVVPSADLFAEPHVDGLIGVAKLLHHAGMNWTLSSAASEAANFALFSGRDADMRALAEHIYTAARELGVTRVAIGECGHAWRVADSYWQGLLGPLDFLAAEHRRPVHVCELSYELLQQGRLRFDPSVHDDKVVTFHDSCNVARGAAMGARPSDQFRIPRALLRACCNRYVDMAANTIREHTYCCGGGGGMLAPELMEIRVKGAMPRVNALRRAMDEHRVTHIAAICAICKTQLAEVLPHYRLQRDMVVGVHQLLGEAIVLG